MRSTYTRSILGLTAVLFAGALITLIQAGVPLSPDSVEATAASTRRFDDDLLSFEERVHYQRAIEEVYWRHRIWPAANPGPKPALEEVLPESVLRERVATYLRKSAALEAFWKRPLTGDQLQAEMNRMVRDTKSPGLLRELFATLDHDPLLVAECLARPMLVHRLARNWYTGAARPDDTTSRADRDKRPFNTWWAEEGRTLVDETEGAVTVLPPMGGYVIQPLRDGGCTVDTWTGSEYVPIDREFPSAVWTGAEMIVWGGISGQDFDTGGRYDPATDIWTPTSTGTGLPSPRYSHTAVWTGTEMIVWGGKGEDYQNTGGRYDPAADSWTPTSTGSSVPIARSSHTAIWTGSEMIVWGGYVVGEQDYLDTGGRYDPSTDSWIATSIGSGVPAGRRGHSAVWTGSEMIVWGGYFYGSGDIVHLITGGRYDPATDAWTETSIGSGVPAGRALHSAVWTGSEMVVWGGRGVDWDYLDTGGKYDPATDDWTPTSTGLGVPSPRYEQSAVWTGSEMIVWGGHDGGHHLNTGGKYDPLGDTWTSTSTGVAVPTARGRHAAVWTGTEMIVWGGGRGASAGGRYAPATDRWTPTAVGPGVPGPRVDHTAVWTGAEMIVWGGRGHSESNTGGRYDPATDTWTETSTGAGVPAARFDHAAVWTGTKMIVWGGDGDVHTYVGVVVDSLNTGGEYNPVTDSWEATSIEIGVPSGRYEPTAVWTGIEMVVWGGLRVSVLVNTHEALWEGQDTGGRYNPTTRNWTPTSLSRVPTARWDHTAVWTGSEMVVWGGRAHHDYFTRLNSGGKYDPSTDRWSAMSTDPGVPSPRQDHSAVWTGSEMIVWGGDDGNKINTGGRYAPATDTWTETSTGSGVPTGREGHSVVWTGSEMIVWGGSPGEWQGYLDTGGKYDPSTDSWIATSTGSSVPKARSSHTAIWTGSEMIVWAGLTSGGSLNSVGLYCACEGITVSTWYVDADGDGLGADSTAIPACEQPPGYIALGGDCDDRYAGCTTDCTDADLDGMPACAPDCDNANPNCTTDCTDADADTYCVTHDCDDTNDDTYPGATEINDGLDNQCPYDVGNGIVDEITGVCGFHNSIDIDEFSWPAQAGATSYEVARSPHRWFRSGCLVIETSATQWLDTEPVPPGVCLYYLVRPTQPNLGSWGVRSGGTERALNYCP